jgi:GntR family transcriptional repressor for pyruvate dehydrogenase complex
METIINKQTEPDNSLDLIIRQLKDLLKSGELSPGDRLPSERKLAEHFGVSRALVRDAIKKLEFYGVVKTMPQSGSFISGLDIIALENLITDALQVETYDFYSLAESRLILETNIIRLACRRRTDDDLIKLENQMIVYDQKVSADVPAVEDDLNFHKQIAEASKNQVLKSMLLIIAPDIMTNYLRHKSVVEPSKRSLATIEHRLLLEYIRKQDEEAAVNLMAQHLKGVMEYSKLLKI